MKFKKGKVIGFIHSGITVRNLEKALHFYVDILGLDLVSKKVSNSKYIFDLVKLLNLKEIKIAYVQLPDAHIIEILEYVGIDRKSGSTRPCDYGAGHICLNVENIEEIHREYKIKGVEFRTENVIHIDDGPNKGSKAIYMLDPDGYIIELKELYIQTETI